MPAVEHASGRSFCKARRLDPARANRMTKIRHLESDFKIAPGLRAPTRISPDAHVC
jgi:hypothetical protein